MTAPITVYTMEEVAAHLKVSRRVLQDLIKEFPYYRRAGRRKLFTAEDINEIVRRLPCRSSSTGAGIPPTTTSGALSEASLWTKAQKLLTAPPRKPSGSRGKRSSCYVASMAEARRQRSHV